MPEDHQRDSVPGQRRLASSLWALVRVPFTSPHPPRRPHTSHRTATSRGPRSGSGHHARRRADSSPAGVALLRDDGNPRSPIIGPHAEAGPLGAADRWAPLGLGAGAPPFEVEVVCESRRCTGSPDGARDAGAGAEEAPFGGGDGGGISIGDGIGDGGGVGDGGDGFGGAKKDDAAARAKGRRGYGTTQATAVGEDADGVEFHDIGGARDAGRGDAVVCSDEMPDEASDEFFGEMSDEFLEEMSDEMPDDASGDAADDDGEVGLASRAGRAGRSSRHGRDSSAARRGKQRSWGTTAIGMGDGKRGRRAALPFVVSLFVVLACSVADLVFGYYVILYMSRIVGKLVDHDAQGAYESLAASSVAMVGASIARAGRTLGAEWCSVVWRGSLVTRLHALYMGRRGFARSPGAGPESRGRGRGRGREREREHGLELLLSGEGDASRASGAGSGQFGTNAEEIPCGAYYEMQRDGSRVDNPDQRIAKDAADFATTFGSLADVVGTAPLTIALYTWRTWAEVGWMAPLAIYVYFAVGWFATRIVMNPIVSLVFRQERLEGDFRFAHVRVRAHAESIAFYGGAARERERLDSSLNDVLRNRLKLARRHFGLGLLSHVYAYAGSALVYAFIAVAVLSGGAYKDATAGELSAHISRAVTFCISLMAGFTSFIDASPMMSDWVGYGLRVSEMISSLERSASGGGGGGGGGGDGEGDGYGYGNGDRDGEFTKGSGARGTAETAGDDEGRARDAAAFADARGATIVGSDILSFKNVTVSTPGGGRIVASDLSFTLRPGDRGLLITGPSGCGKSSILRVLSGLWPPHDGVVCRPRPSRLRRGRPAQSAAGSNAVVENEAGGGARGEPRRGVMFLAQSPFLPAGTLAEQLTYPESPRGVARGTLLQLLDAVGLTHLASSDAAALGDGGDPWRVPRQWDASLSPGEQQRLALARLLFHAPVLQYAILDESTSAIDVAMEHAIYARIAAKGVTVVTVTHRDTLSDFHDKTLRWSGPGSWELLPIP